ncbi:protein of unknown function [Andreprevotia lacus DSM 23236]|jgi:hypothetical protein|uniref:DUF3291 domain-containing protein n=1 Tax=Andreprevotia lacus DSM 23236 TaxID=1121001 RepID=A0A1W1XZW7_9NEIS|nr:DUF3291 domain-containing protein [Andreprevotia lacus]SMC29038.1 protein of unknown function [Andreprevotia lacus DSM 23236]
MSAFELAQVNIATLKAPLDSPELADFVANLDRINALAEASPGFVWRLQDEEGDATALRPFGPEVLVNMSVWRDVVALSDYVFRSAHTEVLKRRREWFERMDTAYTVLWWVPAGHRPTVVEAAARLAHLQAHGPSGHAFVFSKPFAPPQQLHRELLSD